MESRLITYEKVASQFGDWALKLKPFIESEEFGRIFTFLKNESREGKIICPHHTNTFRAFKETPYKNLRSIFLLQDPYPWIYNGVYVADGMAMSCSNTRICQPSLELFYRGMEDDLGIKVPYEPDLSYLANQGILLLNCSLTTEYKKTSSHEGLWNKFIYYLVEEVINFYNPGLIYVSFGSNAHVMSKAILPFLHYGIEVEHPAYAARKQRDWEHKSIFRKINKILKECNNEKIIWSHDDYTRTKEQSESIQVKE